MVSNYRETGQNVTPEDASQYSQGIGIMNVLAEALRQEKLLPERFSQPSPELVRPPLSPETQRLVEHLKRDGYAVYETQGKTPASLRTEGMPFWYVNPALEDESAEPALLAFKRGPSKFFLKGSLGISFDDQLKLLEEEKARVESMYPAAGLTVRLGKAPEYPELAFAHFKATGKRERLFGREHGYRWTWTDTYESEQPGARRADVGDRDEALGLRVNFGRPGYVHPSLGLAPLVEIPRK